MTRRRHTLSTVTMVLAFCVALNGQTGKKSAQVKQESLPTLSAQEIFKRVAPSVMVVESLDAEGKVTKFGSGVVIATGSIITNRHVVEDGVTFRIDHNGKTWPAKLIKVDPDHDLAELSVDGLNVPALQVRDSSKLAVGEKVYTIGAPEGLELTISEGLISGLRDFDKGRVIQTSAAISPGSSGGGLFDAQGRLVGITTFYLKEGQSLNFALAGEWVQSLDHQPPISTSAASESSPAFEALVWYEAALKAFGADKYEDAVYAWQQAARLKPDLAGAWIGLGSAYLQLKQYENAVHAEEEGVRLKPDDEVSWFILGIAYNQIDQNDKAVSALQQAIRLKSDYASAWARLGAAYRDVNQYEDAIHAEEEAIRLKPDDEYAWSYLGAAYVQLKQSEKAIQAEEEAIRLKPDDALAWAMLASANLQTKEYDKAITAEKEAIHLSPDNPYEWYLLGLAFKGVGRQAEVIQVYEKLKILDSKLAEKFFRDEVLP